MLNKRNLSTTLLKSQRNIKIYALTMAGLFLVMGFAIEILLASVRQNLLQIFELYQVDSDVPDLINQSLNTPLILIVLFILVFGCYSFYSWLTMINRTLGPQVPILNHIIELKKGNFLNRIKLRKNDELQELADALNELAEKLAEKNPKDR